jgi:hypothetical protein
VKLSAAVVRGPVRRVPGAGKGLEVFDPSSGTADVATAAGKSDRRAPFYLDGLEVVVPLRLGEHVVLRERDDGTRNIVPVPLAACDSPESMRSAWHTRAVAQVDAKEAA